MIGKALHLALASSLCLNVSAVSAAETKLEFNRDVRPILSENCFACHGPDSASRKAGLRLDRREDAIQAKAIIPGQPEQSLAIRRIFASDAGEIMPPPKAHKKLTPGQKEIINKWVAAGAEYQNHWSFIAPKRPEIPGVKNPSWARNPIDRFILADLEKHGLAPAPEADRRALARRLSLDLTGLPPSVAELEAFVNDKAPDYYEKFVDQLLKSPQWGEHRGRYWLDAARYADSHGIHFDNYREMWAYRDWVINAFNENKPFDQFTIEQLAGDLLPNKTVDQDVASGFNRCHITSAEGGMIAEEYLVLYTRDRVETTAAVWMGLTANCCVCHDHKFDPISQREFYSLAAFFNNTTQGASDLNVFNTPPIITVPRLEDRPRWDAAVKEIADCQHKLAARKKEARGTFDKWLATARPALPKSSTVEGMVFQAALDEGKGKEFALNVGGKTRKVSIDSGFSWVPGRGDSKAFSIQPGASLDVSDAGDFDKSQKYTATAWVKLLKRGQTGAIVARMDNGNKHRGWDVWIQGDKIGTHIVSAWPEDALKVVARAALPLNEWTHVVVTYDGSAKAAGTHIYYNGVLQTLDVESDKLQNTIRTKVPFKVGQRHTSERVSGVAVQDIRLFDRELSRTDATLLGKQQRANELLTKAADKRTSRELDELYEWWIASNDKPYREAEARLNAVQREEASLKSRGAIAYVMNERMEQPSAFILYRGDYDKRRDQVKPATPKILPAFTDELPKNRLGFARWLMKPEQPLTARVTINRFWQELFGTGIVRSTGDFGIAGELPSNQELLDWLAVDFRESGWDVKKFFRLIVTSSAYRQAALVTPEKLDKDPGNRLLSRGTRYRMDAEMIRDNALAASGLLVKKVGGPSVKPYQPDGVWEAVAMIGSNTRDYRRDSGEKLYRRSMYTFWKRAAPPASMEIFNAPNRETCATRRERTNTPLQALVTLNDPQFIEAAKVLAQKALKEGGDKFESRLDFMTKRLLARSMRPEEAKVVQGVLNDLQSFYKEHPEEARKLLGVGEAQPEPAMDSTGLAAWTMVANQLMNLDEVLNK